MNGSPTHTRIWCHALFLMLLLGGLVGCGSSGPTMGRVEGTITVDGQPAAQGAISFIPVDGMSPTAGTKIVDGKYRAEVPVGNCRVEIRIPKTVGQRKAYNTPDSPMIPIVEEVLPGKYNDYSELTIEVEAGTTERNFDLYSK